MASWASWKKKWNYETENETKTHVETLLPQVGKILFFALLAKNNLDGILLSIIIDIVRHYPSSGKRRRTIKKNIIIG